jgi:hypothetical protein
MVVMAGRMAVSIAIHRWSADSRGSRGARLFEQDWSKPSRRSSPGFPWFTDSGQSSLGMLHHVGCSDPIGLADLDGGEYSLLTCCSDLLELARPSIRGLSCFPSDSILS